MKSEKEAEHERNILDMTQVDDYKSPWKDKDALTVNDSEYHNSDEYKDEISDLSKHVDVNKEPITDTHVCNTSVGIRKCQASRRWSQNHWTRHHPRRD